MPRIISRAESGLRPAVARYAIATPSPRLWLHHSAGALDQGGNGVWWDDVRGIQNFHMDVRRWSDIAYSFLVGGGEVFEGRGVGIAGGHTAGDNSTSHAICLIGNYETMQPQQRDLDAIAWLVRHGRDHGWWGDLTGPHQDAPGASTACCGRHLIARIPDIRHATASPANPSKSEENTMIFAHPNGEWFIVTSGDIAWTANKHTIDTARVDVQVKTVAAWEKLRDSIPRLVRL